MTNNRLNGCAWHYPFMCHKIRKCILCMIEKKKYKLYIHFNDFILLFACLDIQGKKATQNSSLLFLKYFIPYNKL